MINFACKIVEISSTQLLGLAETPIKILDGIENEILIPHRVALLYCPLSVPYLTSATNIAIVFGDIVFGKISLNFFSSNIGISTLINIKDVDNIQIDEMINKPLLLKNLGKDLVNGDGYLKVFTFYSTLDTNQIIPTTKSIDK